MSVYYPSGSCNEGNVPGYACNPCPTYEYGRVRSWVFIKNSFAFTDPENPVEWQAGIENGDIIVLWKTQGTYDGGNTGELPGFGDDATVNGNTTHTAVIKDPNYADNCDFYNALRSSSDYKGAYRTSSKVHFTNAPVTVTPKNPVQDDINSVLVWEAQIKWTSPDSPCAYNIPAGIFDRCYINP